MLVSDVISSSLGKGILFALILISVIIAVVYATGLYKCIFQSFSRAIATIKSLLYVAGMSKDKGELSFDESIEISGYAYDRNQDIFYSILDPWQRNFGYCRLYDEATAPLGMIVDCEPIYFEYSGKKWLIEFWKGQYDLPVGCELGIYTTKGPDFDIPGYFKGTFYNCASNDEFLWMSYSLKKEGETIFTRKGKHWWLTGFRLGEFAEPSELSMDITISFKDRIMCNAFLKGMENAGYSRNEIIRLGNTVSFVFDKPHTAQPVTRTEVTDAILQKKNKLLCDTYQEAVRGCITIEDKIKAVRKRAPELYGYIISLGRTEKVYSSFEKIKEFLD